MAARDGSTASRIAKILTETINFHSSEITDAVTEYSGDTGAHDDSDEWTSDHEADMLEENSSEASEGESLFTFDSMIMKNTNVKQVVFMLSKGMNWNNSMIEA